MITLFEKILVIMTTIWWYLFTQCLIQNKELQQNLQHNLQSLQNPRWHADCFDFKMTPSFKKEQRALTNDLHLTREKYDNVLTMEHQ